MPSPDRARSPRFGSVDTEQPLEDPDVVVQGSRVLHLRYRVHRCPI
jgi:hypothetical protein